MKSEKKILTDYKPKYKEILYLCRHKVAYLAHCAMICRGSLLKICKVLSLMIEGHKSIVAAKDGCRLVKLPYVKNQIMDAILARETKITIAFSAARAIGSVHLYHSARHCMGLVM